ncbi:hypothetical protein [Sulfurirhabdus autotrophica]|uniref:Uncharacterized protein n=1 Tax=Sulfurirhabdus autotrophica TaxID=1706046 RepID=A0A4R3Y953_9PROT|nr:hypothetical protein [Sulfurirhabdus autotrophica]TCV87498.1 hypothetical protein EDC63_105167 [Sulfurirhabdus autotrophica]
MKRILIAAVFVATPFTTSAIAADVGVSVSIGQPGFYGRIDIGGYPQPQVIYRQPMIIERVPVSRPPIYLRVPPGHAKHWSKHCREYNACGERVYFVQDKWYSHDYVPRYQEQHRERRDNRYEERRDNRRDMRKDDRRDERKDNRKEKYRNDRQVNDNGRGRDR